MIPVMMSPDPSAGLPTDPNTTLVPGLDIDGSWRHVAAGTLRETCFVVHNQRIVQVDDGCNGNLKTVFSSPGTQAFGSRITMFVGVGDSPTDMINGALYTYMLEVMGDGTLVGHGVLRRQPSGPITEGDVVWVRQ